MKSGSARNRPSVSLKAGYHWQRRLIGSNGGGAGVQAAGFAGFVALLGFGVEAAVLLGFQLYGRDGDGAVAGPTATKLKNASHTGSRAPVLGSSATALT